jgi:hypothetical protein
MIVTASFEDFIYIIIGLVWVIFSYYNAKKKKENKAKQPSQARKSSLLDTIINEIGIKTGEDTPVYSTSYLEEDIIDEKNNDIEQENYKNYNTDTVFSYDDHYEESNFTPVANVFDIKQSPISEKSTTTLSETKKLIGKKAKKIDLRKAVIYSEILKKKYF